MVPSHPYKWEHRCCNVLVLSHFGRYWLHRYSFPWNLGADICVGNFTKQYNILIKTYLFAPRTPLTWVNPPENGLPGIKCQTKQNIHVLYFSLIGKFTAKPIRDVSHSIANQRRELLKPLCLFTLTTRQAWADDKFKYRVSQKSRPLFDALYLKIWI